MTESNSFFKFDTLISRENPLFKTFEKTHRVYFEAFDKAARLQLSLAEDLLDLNRKRFDSLYAGDNLMDKVSVQQELATELGKRTASWVGDLQEVAGDLQSGFSEAANELVTPVAGKAPAARSKKAKAA